MLQELLRVYHENQSNNFSHKLFNHLAETFIFKKFMIKELKSLMPIFLVIQITKKNILKKDF